MRFIPDFIMIVASVTDLVVSGVSLVLQEMERTVLGQKGPAPQPLPGILPMEDLLKRELWWASGGRKTGCKEADRL